MIKYIVRLSLVLNGIAFYIILLIQNHSSIMFPQSQCPYATASVRNNLSILVPVVLQSDGYSVTE